MLLLTSLLLHVSIASHHMVFMWHISAAVVVCIVIAVWLALAVDAAACLACFYLMIVLCVLSDCECMPLLNMRHA